MNSAVCTTSTGVFGSYYNNIAGYYGLPIIFRQPYLIPPTTKNPLIDMEINNRCSSFGPYMQKIAWDNNSEGDDTSQPTPKRRRISMQSDDSVSEKFFSSQGISSAGFIQHAFAPKLGQRMKQFCSTEIETEKQISMLQYNKNMVRKFPQKQRTTKEQERRDKNTLACRISRCKEKVKNLAIEEQRKVVLQQTFEISRESMKRAAYLNELLKYGVIIKPKALNKQVVDKIAKKLDFTLLKNIPTEMPTQDTTKAGKRPFSMAFLLG